MAALREIDRLWGAAGTPEGSRLDALATLVERYESLHYPAPQADPVEVIVTHMEMTGRSRGNWPHCWDRPLAPPKSSTASGR